MVITRNYDRFAEYDISSISMFFILNGVTMLIPNTHTQTKYA